MPLYRAFATVGAMTIWSRILDLIEEHANLVGVGNIGGIGIELLNLIETKEQAK